MELELKELGLRIDKLALLRRVTLGRIFQAHGLHFGQLRLLEYIIENDVHAAEVRIMVAMRFPRKG